MSYELKVDKKKKKRQKEAKDITFLSCYSLLFFIERISSSVHLNFSRVSQAIIKRVVHATEKNSRYSDGFPITDNTAIRTQCI